MATISIEAKQGVYLLYKNYPYKAPQVFGEFIDNAIQSAEDHKIQMTSESPEYQLKVDIDIEWFNDPADNIVKAKSITIQDNAAGMNGDRFKYALNLADDRVTRQGMNEFGVGMKGASAWLGNKWHIETTSIEDGMTRVVDVDLNEISSKQIKTLESQDTYDSTRKPGTTITITELWKENVIKKNSEGDLIKNIASIYRYFIRNQEIQIYIGDKLLTFEDYPILEAPWHNDPDGKSIKWKKNVTIDDHQGHTITGFVALLKDMSDENRGVVFTRNRRVVLGFNPEDRTIGKDFMGQIGSRKYRRVFGELEITGISVAFGKNQVSDSDLLESLCKSVAGKLKVEGYNLLTQGAQYVKKAKATSKPIVPPVDPPKTPIDTPVEPPTVLPPVVPHTSSPVNLPVVTTKAKVLATDSFVFDGKTFKIDIVESTDSPELFWNDLSQASEEKLLCKVNPNHPFFARYGQPGKAMIALFKALSIAKYKTLVGGSGNATEMMNEFNSIIFTLN